MDRNRGVKAKSLAKLGPIVDMLLEMSPVAKLVPAKLLSTIVDFISENPRRKILSLRSREDAAAYVKSQVGRCTVTIKKIVPLCFFNVLILFVNLSQPAPARGWGHRWYHSSGGWG